MKSLLSICVLALLLPGCAANMAASGQNGPDINVVQQQRNRADIERMLGLPKETIHKDNGEIVQLYVVEARTEPSAIRAAGHATMDLFTLGFWEFVGGPTEAYQGRRQNVRVHYDKQERVVSIESDRMLHIVGLQYGANQQDDTGGR